MPRYVNLANLQQFAAVNLNLDPGAVGGPVVIPNAVQVTLLWGQASGKYAHNVLYGRSPGVPSPTVAQAQAIFAAISSGSLWTAHATHLAVSTVLISVSLRSVHSANLPVVGSTGAYVAGTNVALALPNEVAMCITLRTAFTGPRNRGRMYLPGFSTDQVIAGNVILATAITAANAWVTSIGPALTSQGYTWVLGQRARAAYTGSTGTAYPARAAGTVDIVSAAARDNAWDSQRRRGL